jgi:hypothetical protein
VRRPTKFQGRRPSSKHRIRIPRACVSTFKLLIENGIKRIKNVLITWQKRWNTKQSRWYKSVEKPDLKKVVNFIMVEINQI